MLSVHYNYGARHAARNNAAAQRSRATAMEQISSGYRINKASDAPADLIISEQLRSQIEGLERAIRNTEESGNVLGIMEGALGQVQNIITKMRGLAIDSANSGVISKDRIAANQAELDSGLQTIGRILETTSYGGQKLLANMRKFGVIGEDYTGLINAERLLRENGGKLPMERLYEKGGIADKLYMLAGEEKHAQQLSDDGTLLNGDKTFVLPPAEEGGDPVELRFREGTSLDEVLKKVREHMPDSPEAAATPGRGREGELILRDAPLEGMGGLLFGSDSLTQRVGGDINRVEFSEGQLATLAGLSDEDAKARLGNYMQNFTRELELDIGGWNKLSDADKSMLVTADHLSGMSLDSLGQTRVQSGTDKDGNPIYDTLSMTDLFSGGKASLAKDPAAAMQVLDNARTGITMSRAQVAATQNMHMYSMNAMEAAHESATRLESYIRDTEYAAATTELARADMLSQASMSMIGSAQRQQKQFILDLLA